MTEASTKAAHPPVRVLLAQVMAAVRAVGKHDYNQGQKFNFRGIDAVLNAVGPALRDVGIVPLPVYDKPEVTYVESKDGKRQTHAIIGVQFAFLGPAGDCETVKVYGEAMDTGDKAISKASSVAFRTALIQTLALPTDEPDPDASTYDIAPAPDDDSPSVLRARIAEVVQAKGWTLEDAGSDFKARMKTDIREADSDTLREYLQRIEAKK